MSRWRRLVVYLVPGTVAALGALIAVLSVDDLRPSLVMVVAVVIGLGFAAPAVDRLRDRVRRTEAIAGRNTDSSRVHFDPRARGVLPTQVRSGDYFTGREAVLAELTGWVGSGGDGRGRVVTGDPGSGKSAVLGRLAAQCRSQPVVTVYARGRTVAEVADEVAAGLGLEPSGAAGLIADLRSWRGDAVVVVDAVDEAVQPFELVQDLLQPLAASSAVTGLRCAFGSRRGGDGHLLTGFGESVTILDLDVEPYADPAGLVTYVQQTLLATVDPGLPTPYRGEPELAGRVARVVAAGAGHSFLVAQLHALSLMAATDARDERSTREFVAAATGVGPAMDRYLREAGPDGDAARDLLVALAWAEGDGFDSFSTWAATATALGAAEYGESDVERLLRSAAVNLISIARTGDRWTACVFHEALAEHLRASTLRFRTEADVQRRITTALAGLVRDWPAAGRYVRTHLATHAAVGRCLDGFLDNPDFLVVADVSRLLPALASARNPRARAVERIGQQLLTTDPRERVSYLELAARMAGDDEFAERVDRIDPGRPWRVTWAQWSTPDESEILGHFDTLVEVRVVELPDGPIVVAAGQWAVRAWHVRDGSAVRGGIGHPHAAINGMVAYADNADVVVVTSHVDGRVRRAGLLTGSPSRELSSAGQSWAMWTLVHDGRRVIVQDVDDETFAFDPDTDTVIAWPRLPITGRIVAAAVVDGRPLGVFSYILYWSRPRTPIPEERCIEVRDLRTGTVLGRRMWPEDEVTGWRAGAVVWSAAIYSVDGVVTVLVGGSLNGGHVFRWEPESGTTGSMEPYSALDGALSTAVGNTDPHLLAVGDSLGVVHLRPTAGEWLRLTIHDNGVEWLDVTRCDGTDVLVTGGRDGTVRLVRPPPHRVTSSPALSRLIRRPTHRNGTRQLMALQDIDGRVRVIDPASGEPVHTHPFADTDPVRDLAIDAAPQPTLVTLHSNGTISLRPAAHDGHVRTLNTPPGDWHTLAVGPTEPPVIVLYATDGAMAFLDLASGSTRWPTIRCHNGNYALALGPDRADREFSFVTAQDPPAPQVIRWTLTNSGTPHSVTLPVSDPPGRVHIRPDLYEFAWGAHGGRRIIAGAGSHVQVWDADDGDLVWSRYLERTNGMAINAIEIGTIAGRTYVITGGHTCTLGFIDVETQEERHLRIGSHLWSITALGDGEFTVAGVRGVMGIAFLEAPGS
ncbi:hypothetical protein GCM10009557_51900 [Virgisporangium ochraceum]|uniref:Uncharacterized protein n=1 Tax=Virgisporangium ochraceum TaxID=65505 RepID=A0A8J4A336_9ACTN|nr:hypothetical protein [Virgisporangium ochraceum]GIJ74854.1 hypothetical protein Voc01_097710 [Virgisporangium ochraceum]